ncbi:hypothetical protein AXK59_08040 [Tsukamurella tyrosinosolvens]|nr:hypothetical protein AXK59_08040 [Tsukamurella tyrosinosolvens]KZL95311.1 hypothetical protein AXX05_19065 [Tsukamurella tyrosinosolvens]
MEWNYFELTRRMQLPIGCWQGTRISKSAVNRLIDHTVCPARYLATAPTSREYIDESAESVVLQNVLASLNDELRDNLAENLGVEQALDDIDSVVGQFPGGINAPREGKL